MENTVPQRVKRILSEKRWTTNQLSKALEISQPTVSRQISGSVALSADLVCGVLSVFPDVSAEWLMRGTGPMLLDGSGPDPELKEICIKQTREIYRLRQRLDEYEQPKKGHA